MPIPTTDELLTLFNTYSGEITLSIQSLATQEIEDGLDTDDIEEFNQYKKVFTWDSEYTVNASYVLHQLDLEKEFDNYEDFEACLEGKTHNTFDAWESDDVDLHEGEIDYREGSVIISNIQLNPTFKSEKLTRSVTGALHSNATDLKSEIRAFEVVLAEKKKEYDNELGQVSSVLEEKKKQLEELLRQSPSD